MLDYFNELIFKFANKQWRVDFPDYTLLDKPDHINSDMINGSFGAIAVKT